MRAVAAACTSALLMVGCWGSGAPATPPSPDEAVTVRVDNHSGGPITVSYSFARTPATRLGNVGRLGQAEFSFYWESGPLEFVVDLPGALMTSNRMSTRPGETIYLDVSSREARASKEGGGT